jgi:transposase
VKSGKNKPVLTAFAKQDEKQSDTPDIQGLYQQIGQLKVENDFLKKSLRKIGL